MELAERIKQHRYWYHKIELPGGVVTPGWSPICAEKYAIPDDLTGKRILDVGAWDGYWTWEALKRGASEVVAIDDFSDTCGKDEIQRGGWATFDLCREAFGFLNEPEASAFPPCQWANANGQELIRLESSVYDLGTMGLGPFDIVFLFGTLYHLKHPMLALEKIAGVLAEDGQLFIELAICDDYSPYHGGLNKGYHDNDMVTEFYPGAEYGNNAGNWWCPTLQCLGYMVQAAGFKQVELWRLTENPQDAVQCRGFCWASKAEIQTPPNVKREAQTQAVLRRRPKVHAVMSVPRLGFQDNNFCAMESIVPLKIPLTKVQGVYWGQCLERGLQSAIDSGAEMLLTIDYDTLFTKGDVQELIALMEAHPEAAAMVPMQVGREGKSALATLRTRSGQRWTDVPREVFKSEIVPIATGHFGLTLIRTEALLKMPHPWFLPAPDKDGMWGRDRTDEDIAFWRLFSKSGLQAYLAPRIVIGHLELVAVWPDTNLSPVCQTRSEFYEKGKPQNAWK